MKWKDERLILSCFFTCFIFWLYLFFTTTMMITCDALDYRQLGADIFEKGWGHYFSGGPHREPLYPAIVAFSYYIQQLWGIDYQYVQKIIQLLCLFTTQIIILKLARLWGLRKGLQVLLILLIGFSPALVNAALSLYSEILVLPIICALVLVMHQFFVSIKERSFIDVVGYSIFLAVLFVSIVMVKAMFEMIFNVFLIFFLLMMVFFVFKKAWELLRRTVVSFLILLIISGGAIAGYKYTNFIHNGEYAITGRARDILFGNVFKRTHELTTAQWLAHLSAIPGEGVCLKFFSLKECQYAGFLGADEFRREDVFISLVGHQEEKDITPYVYQVTFKRLKERPIQYAVLSFMEMLKMFFWESTQGGFVNYPKPMVTLYGMNLLSDLWRGIISVLTVGAYIYQIVFLVRGFRRYGLAMFQQNSILLSFIIVTIFTFYTAFYGVASIVLRYALVFGPLHLLCVAKWLEDVALRRLKSAP